MFALAAATLGPRAGFFAGFVLMATSTVFPLVVAGRLALGLAIAGLVPGLAREDGLEVPGADERRG